MKAFFARFGYALALLVVIGYVLITLRGPRGVRAWAERTVQIKVMEKQNAALAREIEEKRQHIKRLSENPAESELELIDKYWLVPRGDKVKVYVLGKPATAPPPDRH